MSLHIEVVREDPKPTPIKEVVITLDALRVRHLIRDITQFAPEPQGYNTKYIRTFRNRLTEALGDQA